MRHAIYGLAAGTALAAAAAWLFLADRGIPQQPPVAIPAPVLREPAPPPQDAAAQLQSPAGPAEPPGGSSAAFEARFKAAKAAREARRLAPDPAILQARTFPEAFKAMKRAESQPPAAENAGANPFAAVR
jgi:hypothetical protein